MLSHPVTLLFLLHNSISINIFTHSIHYLPLTLSLPIFLSFSRFLILPPSLPKYPSLSPLEFHNEIDFCPTLTCKIQYIMSDIVDNNIYHSQFVLSSNFKTISNNAVLHCFCSIPKPGQFCA